MIMQLCFKPCKILQGLVHKFRLKWSKYQNW